MRRILSSLALSALMALGVAALAPSAGASALSAGATAVDAAKTVQSAGEEKIVKANHRRHHRHWRRHHRPRSGFYFEFGTGGYRYGPPRYYERPRYVRPRYVRPRYVAPRPAYRLSSAHVRWCYDRYRSYRASDNTFQPYNGPRRPCISPYMR